MSTFTQRALDLDEDDPLYKAINKGGGQTCDIAGVVRELEAAEFLILPKSLVVQAAISLNATGDDACRHLAECLCEPDQWAEPEPDPCWATRHETEAKFK